MPRRLRLPPPIRPQRQQAIYQPEAMPDYLNPLGLQPEPERDESYGYGGGDFAPQSPPMSPEEESSLLGNVMSGVSWLGSSLDKPGAAVRGLISGALGGTGEQAGAGALANLIPFSDTLGITNPEQRVSGRDLLEQAGVAAPNQPGLFNSWGDFAGDVGGFAAEVATDPLLYLTGPLGTFTKSGQAVLKGAEKVGTTSADFGKAAAQLTSKKPLVGQVMSTTPAAVAEQFRQGLRAPLGLHVPFTDINAALPVPQAVNDLVANALDKVTYGKLSPIPLARGALSHTAGGVYKGAVQRERDLRWAEKEAMKNQLMDAAPAFRARADDLEKRFAEIASHHRIQGDAASYQAFEREMLETADKLPDAAGILDAIKTRWKLPADASLEGVSAETADLADKFHEFFDAMHTSVKDAGQRYIDLGGNLKQLNDKYAEYFPRRLSPSIQKMIQARQAEKGQGGLPDIMQFWRARKDYLKNYPGRSAGLNRMATDPAFMGTKEVDGAIVKMTPEEHVQALLDAAKEAKIAVDPKSSRAVLRKQYVLEKYVKPDLQIARDSGRITAEEYAKELKRFTDSAAPENLAAVSKTGGKAIDATDRMISAFARLPRDVVKSGLFDRRAVDDWHAYMNAMAETESTLRTAHSLLAQPKIVSVAGDGVPLARAWKDAGFNAKGLHTFLAENTDDGKLFATGSYDPTKAGDFIKGLTVEPKAAKVLRAFGELTKPDKLSEIGGLIDKINATYKGLLTVPFPSFHARNLASGYWQNLADGELGAVELTGAYHDALRYAKGNKAKMQFAEEFVQNGGLHGHGQMVDITGQAAENAVPTGGFMELFSPLKKAFQNPKQAAKDALKIRGGFGSLTTEPGTQNVLMEMGDKAYNWVEFLNRAAPYEALRRKGFTPAQAMYRVNRAQFVYGQLAPLEKTYLRRIAPFYNWVRRSIPYTLQRLFERPGGVVGQSFRLESQPSAKDEYTPGFLKEGMNIPWGGGTPEATTFLRQAGLPIEDLNRFVFAGGKPNLQRTAEKFGAQIHPLLTMPIELASGKQLFTGRKIENLDSPTEDWFGTKLPTVDKAIHYSPLSRVIGETRSVFDPRKTWLQSILNATTGFKSGTYDLTKLKPIDLRNALQEKFADNPELIREMTTYFVPPDKRKEPGAAEAMKEVRQRNRLQKTIRQAYKAKDAEKKKKALMPSG